MRLFSLVGDLNYKVLTTRVALTPEIHSSPESMYNFCDK